MGRKMAIFDNEDAKRFLKSARKIDDEIRVFPMLAFGMHPENLRRLKAGDEATKGDKITKDILEFKRAKNDYPRRQLLNRDVADVLHKACSRGVFRISNRAYEQICEYMGHIGIPTYQTHPVSPHTLRHTYILNCLREYKGQNDAMDLVSVKAGCNKSTVIQNYVDLQDWERIHNAYDGSPLNLTDWVFGEGLSGGA
jgi:integrase